MKKSESDFRSKRIGELRIGEIVLKQESVGSAVSTLHSDLSSNLQKVRSKTCCWWKQYWSELNSLHSYSKPFRLTFESLKGAGVNKN